MTIKRSTKVRAIEFLVSLVVLSMVFGGVTSTVVVADNDDGHGNECKGYDEDNLGSSSGVADSGTDNWQRGGCSVKNDEGMVTSTPTPEENLTPGGTDTPTETATPTDNPKNTPTPDNSVRSPTDGDSDPSGGGSDGPNSGSKTPESRDSPKLTRNPGETSASDGDDSSDGPTDESDTGDDGVSDPGDGATDEPDDGSPEPELNAEQNRRDGTPPGDVELSAGAIWWLFLLALLALLLTGGAVYRYYTE